MTYLGHPSEGLVGRAAEQQAFVALIESLDFAGSAAMLVGEAGRARLPCILIWLPGEESETVLAFVADLDLLLP